jgi:hypothetical protein
MSAVRELSYFTRNSKQRPPSIRLGDSTTEMSSAPLPPLFGKRLLEMIQDGAEQGDFGTSIVPAVFRSFCKLLVNEKSYAR